MICLVGNQTFQVPKRAEHSMELPSFGLFEQVRNKFCSLPSCTCSCLLQASRSASDLLPMLKVATSSVGIFLVLRG